ncbi:MAG: hypothetical protein U9Q06_01355 [Nanoarchaeota archaeon]|nr:hypothetical protein [Nanoarchaeota archaeon]
MKKNFIFVIVFVGFLMISLVNAVGYLEFVDYPKCENNIVRFSMENTGDESVDIGDNPVWVMWPGYYQSKGIFSKYIINPGQITEFTSAIGEFSDATTYTLNVPEASSGSIPGVKVICHTNKINNEAKIDGGNTFQCIDGNWKKLSVEPYCSDDEANLYIDKSGNEHCRPSTYSSVTNGAWCYKEEVEVVGEAEKNESIKDLEIKEESTFNLTGYIIIVVAIILGFIILAKFSGRKK